MSDSHAAPPRITTAVWICLKSGALYGAIVMMAAREFVDLGWSESVCFFGLPAAIAAALVIAHRLDRPARPARLDRVDGSGGAEPAL